MQLASVVNRLGEALLAAGETEEAATTFARFTDEAARLRREHPEIPRTHRLHAVALYKQHELARARAEAEGVTEDGRRAALEEALELLDAAHEVFVEMRNAGILQASDAAVPAELAAEIDALLEELE